jgi:hypothetical protein
MLGLPGDCFNPNINAWDPVSSDVPIAWFSQAVAGQIYAYGSVPYLFIHQSDTGLPVPYDQLPVNSNLNVNYYPYANRPDFVYPNQKADAGLSAFGQLSALLDNVLVSSQSLSTSLTQNWNIPPVSGFGSHALSIQTQVQDLAGIVHNLPDNASDPDFNIKNVYADPNPVLFSSAINYTIHVVDTTNCSGTLLSLDPSQFANLLPGETITINITVQNDHPNMPVIATDVSSDNGWSATPGSPPNGFNVPIAPGTRQNITINLTAPDPLGQAPINIYVQFIDPCLSTHLCPANISISLQDDLASLVVAPAFVPITKPPTSFRVEAITFNNGTRPTPLDTNTSVVLDGSPARYYPVPINLPQTTWPGTDGVHPDPPYISQFYPFTCDFPHTAVFTVDADFDNRLTEINEANNHAVGIVQCGTSIGCYDYM